MLKKIRIFTYKHRMFCCIIILLGFLFYLSYVVYQKEDLWGFEKVLKNSLASISNGITPKIEVNYQEVTNTFTKEKEDELNNLRELLDLTNQSSYQLEHASIISRNALSYFNEITINKGKNNEIDKGMLAINEKGLIGVVEYVTKDTATIKLVTTEDASFKIAVSVMNGESIYNGVITGYDQKNEEILVTSIRNQSDIAIGSIVKTNGLGNLYPEGIIVGTVSKIETDSVGVSKILSIKSQIDFRNIRYVSIIKGAKQ